MSDALIIIGVALASGIISWAITAWHLCGVIKAQDGLIKVLEKHLKIEEEYVALLRELVEVSRQRIEILQDGIAIRDKILEDKS